MTANEFRQIALSLPEAVEGSHVGHPDFRVGGKVFASLGYPDDDHGAVMLRPEEQRKFIKQQPAAFFPAVGAWGRRGATQLLLSKADIERAGRAIGSAWQNKAPKRLLAPDP
jgi:hypothetical protein